MSRFLCPELKGARADNERPITIRFRSLADAEYAVHQDARVPTAYQFSRWVCPFVWADGMDNPKALPRDNPTLDYKYEYKGGTTTRAT